MKTQLLRYLRDRGGGVVEEIRLIVKEEAAPASPPPIDEAAVRAIIAEVAFEAEAAKKKEK